MQPGLNSVDWWSDMVEMEWAEQDNNVRSHDGSLAAPVLSLAGPKLPDPVLELQEEGVSAGAVADYQRGVPRSIQDLLEEEVCLPFRSLIIKERPRLRRAQTPVSGRTVRRSGRLAARPRAANATAQAQRVLLKKLGVPVRDDAPEAELEGLVKAAFRGDITARKRVALQTFLEGKVDLVAMDLDVVGVDEALNGGLRAVCCCVAPWFLNVDELFLFQLERARPQRSCAL